LEPGEPGAVRLRFEVRDLTRWWKRIPDKGLPDKQDKHCGKIRCSSGPGGVLANLAIHPDYPEFFDRSNIWLGFLSDLS
jgi:hypothetical protein